MLSWNSCVSAVVLNGSIRVGPPEIAVGAQIFDLAFHPTQSTVYAGLLTGGIKAFWYDDQGSYEERFSLRQSKRSCRGLVVNHDGSQLWAVGKGKEIHVIDTTAGKVVDTRPKAHDVAINRVKCLMPNMLSTGDDDGVIKLWDPRKADSVRTCTQHFDYITDFLWLEDKKQLVATSGDGALSVMDVRSRKAESYTKSEDQEDELLSIVAIKGGTKAVVGTQLGILSIFDRSKGWGDCVDRVPGHPHSVDALCNIPSSYGSSSSTILTGSSDGIIRAVELFPTKLIGVVADSSSYPVERMAVDKNGEGRWLGSVGHEEVLRMTDLREVFEDESGQDEQGEEHLVGLEEEEAERNGLNTSGEQTTAIHGSEACNENDSDIVHEKKRKRKRVKGTLDVKKKKGRNEVDVEASFFAGL